MSQLPSRLSYNLDEAISATGLNRTAFYAAISKNQIKTFKVGRRRMVSARALQEFIEAKEREGTSGAAA
ncbi:hypothetical protein [Stenotrophomonas bentonitica]|uniref:helix-turn-helix domain-containing protein n=1 Tax=Stenotrophomonas bentonitica TaxID=1450134 RepID=UPI00345ECC86